MIKKLLQAAALVVGGLALGGCPLQQAKTTAPTKPPAADYQAASTTPPPAAGSIRAICYNDADLATYRGRMLQQEFTVGTLQCQTAGGSRAYESLYASFLSKYQAELSTNARNLQSHRPARPERQGILRPLQARLRLGAVEPGHHARAGAAAIRPRPRDERPSLPEAVGNQRKQKGRPVGAALFIYALPCRNSRPEWVLVGRSLRIVTSPFTSTYL